MEESIQSHFDGVDDKKGDFSVFPVDATRACYEELKRFADSKGVKIVNCTRGGKLEVFPRQSLEEVLSKKENI
jgi:hypothetical protein